MPRLTSTDLEEFIMRIDEIYSRQAVHIPSSCTLQEAAVQMRDKHVGSLIVTEPTPAGERVAGILTDRDIVLQGTAAGADPGRVVVADVMTPGLITIALHANVHDAMQLMLSHGLRRLGVLDGEEVTGVLSMDDILGAMATDWGMLSTLVRNEQERERSGYVQSPLRM
jgi:signal-transduction protein with cAMP-binding, CBS, and nucleotidyltransferase domain